MGSRQSKPSRKDSVSSQTIPHHHHSGTTHNHVHHVDIFERKKTMIATSGKYRALLTSHICSRSGNELDIFFELSNDQNISLPLHVEKLVGNIKKRDGSTGEIIWACAPISDRPEGEGDGKCSHYVANVPWLTESEVFDICLKVTIGDSMQDFDWTGFDVGKFCHHKD